MKNKTSIDIVEKPAYEINEHLLFATAASLDQNREDWGPLELRVAYLLSLDESVDRGEIFVATCRVMNALKQYVDNKIDFAPVCGAVDRSLSGLSIIPVTIGTRQFLLPYLGKRSCITRNALSVIPREITTPSKITRIVQMTHRHEHLTVIYDDGHYELHSTGVDDNPMYFLEKGSTRLLDFGSNLGPYGIVRSYEPLDLTDLFAPSKEVELKAIANELETIAGSVDFDKDFLAVAVPFSKLLVKARKLHADPELSETENGIKIIGLIDSIERRFSWKYFQHLAKMDLK